MMQEVQEPAQQPQAIEIPIQKATTVLTPRKLTGSKDKYLLKTFNGAYESRAFEYIAPKSIPDLQQTVKDAYRSGRPVRAVGSLRSNTDVAMVDINTVVVSLSNMKRMALDEQNGLVQVEGGVNMGELCTFLKERNYQLGVVPDFDFYNVAACCITQMSTTSSTVSSAFNSQCVGMNYVNYNEEATLGTVDNEEELFYWRSSYGNLGIVYSVTLRVFPTKKVSSSATSPQNVYVALQLNHFKMSLNSFKEDFGRIKRSHEQFYALIDCYHSQVYVQVRDYAEVAEPRKKTIDSGRHWAHYKQYYPWGTVTEVPFLRTVSKNTSIKTAVNNLSQLGLICAHPGSLALPFKGFRKMQFTNVAMPLETCWSAIDDIVTLANDYKTKSNWKLKGGILLYYLPKDTSSVLSRTYDGDRLAIIMYNNTWQDNIFQEFRKEFINITIVKHKGRATLCHTSGIQPNTALMNYDPALLSKWTSRLNPRLFNPFFAALVGRRKSGNTAEASSSTQGVTWTVPAHATSTSMVEIPPQVQEEIRLVEDSATATAAPPVVPSLALPSGATSAPTVPSLAIPHRRTTSMQSEGTPRSARRKSQPIEANSLTSMQTPRTTRTAPPDPNYVLAFSITTTVVNKISL